MGTEEEVFTRPEEFAMSKTFVFLAAIVLVLTFVQAKPATHVTKPGFNATEEDPPKKERPTDDNPLYVFEGDPTEPTVVEDKPDAGEKDLGTQISRSRSIGGSHGMKFIVPN